MAELGQKYRLQISATSSGHATIGGMNSFTLNRERGTTDVNTFDNPQWRESISTMREWSIEGELYYDYDDAGQVLLEAAFASDDPYHFLLTRADGQDGAFEFSGWGFINNMSLEGEMNEAISTPIEIQGTGELTKTEIVAAT